MQKNVLRKLFISHKNDWLLGAALLFAALCLFLVFQIFSPKTGGEVQVKLEGKVVGTYPLNQDSTNTFQTFYGKNILTIQDGQAYMSEANCKDQLCMRMGKISKKGETIICLPNEVFVTVIGGDASDVDAIVR